MEIGIAIKISLIHNVDLTVTVKMTFNVFPRLHAKFSSLITVMLHTVYITF